MTDEGKPAQGERLAIESAIVFRGVLELFVGMLDGCGEGLSGFGMRALQELGDTE